MDCIVRLSPRGKTGGGRETNGKKKAIFLSRYVSWACSIISYAHNIHGYVMYANIYLALVATEFTEYLRLTWNAAILLNQVL